MKIVVTTAQNNEAHGLKESSHLLLFSVFSTSSCCVPIGILRLIRFVLFWGFLVGRVSILLIFFSHSCIAQYKIKGGKNETHFLYICCSALSGWVDWPVVWPDAGVLPHPVPLYRLPRARPPHHHSGKTTHPDTDSSLWPVWMGGLIYGTDSCQVNMAYIWTDHMTIYSYCHCNQTVPHCRGSWKHFWRNAKWPITASPCANCWRRYRRTATTSQDGGRRPPSEWPMLLLWWDFLK